MVKVSVDPDEAPSTTMLPAGVATLGVANRATSASTPTASLRPIEENIAGILEMCIG